MRSLQSFEQLANVDAIWERAELTVAVSAKSRHTLWLKCECGTEVSPIEEEGFVWCPQCGAVFDAAGWRA